MKQKKISAHHVYDGIVAVQIQNCKPCKENSESSGKSRKCVSKAFSDASYLKKTAFEAFTVAISKIERARRTDSAASGKEAAHA